MPNALQREGLRAKKMLRKQGSSKHFDWREADQQQRQRPAQAQGGSKRVSPVSSEDGGSRGNSNPASRNNSQPGSRTGSRQAGKRGGRPSR